MSKVYPTPPDLPDDVVLRVSGVSKKFCRNLKRSMWYGIQDLSKNLMGFRSNPETEDRRPKTEDFFGGEASGSEDAEQGLQSSVSSLQSDPKGLQSAVCGLQSSQNSDGLRPAEFWALRDISFDLKRGECLGLFGKAESRKQKAEIQKSLRSAVCSLRSDPGGDCDSGAGGGALSKV